MDGKYPPPGGPEAGQMLGKRQLIRKEAFNSPSPPFVLKEEKKNVVNNLNLCPSGLNAHTLLRSI